MMIVPIFLMNDMYIHKPVLLTKVLSLLRPEKKESVFIDATIGEGGYSEFLLKDNPDLTVIGIDADSSILEVAKGRLSSFKNRILFYNSWFDHFFENYFDFFSYPPDSILFDLGISRFHYKTGNRGFSFSRNEPLDMRLRGDTDITASTIINTYTESELCHIFWTFGEVRYAKRISKRIVLERMKKPIKTSLMLAKIIEQAVPHKERFKRIHPSTRCFQALRIAVNRELERLEAAIKAAFSVLKEGGRLGVISYHSLEDRIVKHFFKEKSLDCTCPPELPICKCKGYRECEILTRKPIIPDDIEIRENPSARSAKFRVVTKCRIERGK